MCSDGTFTSMQLDAAGALASAKTSASINNIEDDAMFMMPAMVGRTAWFATFRGNLHGIDLSGSEARDLGSFAIVPNPKAVAGWRPSGWQLIASDAAGKLYVLMNPNGREGSHKDPATEVWIIDPIKKAKIGTIALGSPGISVEITRQATPMMIVARADSSIDVYDLATGKRVRTLGATIVFNPMVLMPVTP